MITETPEAITYQNNNPNLEGALLDKTLTKSQMGYMIAKENQHLLNTVNFILSELELRGEVRKVSFIKNRINELEKLGFTGVYLHKSNKADLAKEKIKIKLNYISNISELVERMRI